MDDTGGYAEAARPGPSRDDFTGSINAHARAVPPPRRLLTLAAGVVVGAALLGGCGPTADDRLDQRESAPSEVRARSGGPPPGVTAPEPEEPRATPPDDDDVVVERIVDGDTLVVSGGVRVRLIGIDTPESVHPSKPVECFGPEASDHLGALVPEGTPVRLVHDAERHDRYGRTLAYVWRADGLDVNRTMVEDGYATVYTVPPNVDRQQEFLDAQRSARENDRGLWGGCAGHLDLAPPDPADGGDVAAVGDAAAPAGDCHPSYPDVCIPAPPPDLNCGDIPHRHVRVLPPDPHHLDGDGDGIGCQS